MLRFPIETLMHHAESPLNVTGEACWLQEQEVWYHGQHEPDKVGSEWMWHLHSVGSESCIAFMNTHYADKL